MFQKRANPNSPWSYIQDRLLLQGYLCLFLFLFLFFCFCFVLFLFVCLFVCLFVFWGGYCIASALNFAHLHKQETLILWKQNRCASFMILLCLCSIYINFNTSWTCTMYRTFQLCQNKLSHLSPQQHKFALPRHQQTYHAVKCPWVRPHSTG